MPKNLRIVMVAARYHPFMGGIETHIHEVGMRMAMLGHRVTVLTTDNTGCLPSDEFKDGLNIRRVMAWPKNHDYYFAPRIYSEIVQQQQCDLIHFQGYNTFVAPIGMTAAIRYKIPFVLTFHSGGHSSGLRNSIRGVQQSLLGPIVARADRLIGVSQFEADHFSQQMRLDPKRFVVVPNGASLPAPSDPRPIVDPNLILSVGRLEQYKGHHRAIEALPKLLKQAPDVRLQIVGSGPYEAELRTLVNRLNLGDRISFVSIPPAERQRLTDLFCSARLVLLLSDYEAHPVSVMEALSVQRPVLVTDTSGLRELAQKGLCRSIALDATPDMIADAIVGELTAEHNPAAISLPDWDDCTEQLLGIYTSVVEKQRSDIPTAA